jgi:hypothetical protein
MNENEKDLLADKQEPGLSENQKAIESDPNTATLRELIAYKQVVKGNVSSLNHS